MAKGQKKQKLTPETIGKLEQAFAIDATVGEACFYADINPDTYYRWINENKELNEKFTRLREKPILTARQTIAKSLHEPEHAKWYLERKKKLEFSTRNELDHTTKGESIVALSPEQKEQLLKLIK